ncbi:hypothetical protein V3851_07780 [Paenibacillus sp. M1]|uniref:Multidrug transporter n=1 Tax=Paenibacillus haidiansis TaxID=1574488 RepID=A0ABU7VPQ0_9BACL
MPYDRKPDTTDGDPDTIYEDTSPHPRTGFLPEQLDITAMPANEADENGSHKRESETR